MGNFVQWARKCKAELQLEHENSVFCKFVSLANELGYRYAAYGLELPISVAEPWFAFYSNYSSNWHRYFGEQRPPRDDARVALKKRSAQTYPDENVHYWNRADFLREARANGIAIEWTRKMRCVAGAVATVALSGLEAVREPRLEEQTWVLAHLASESMSRLLVNKYLPQRAVTLSEVERAYMCWVLDGKTSSEIADILNIGKASVEHMQRKLPERFERSGIFVTSLLAYRMGMLGHTLCSREGLSGMRSEFESERAMSAAVS